MVLLLTAFGAPLRADITAEALTKDVTLPGTSDRVSTPAKLMVAVEPRAVPGLILDELGLRLNGAALQGKALLDALPHETVTVTNMTSTASGELAYLVASTKSKGRDIYSKQDFSYFINYAYEHPTYGWLTRRVGLAIRLTAAVVSDFSASLNTASLFSLSASVAAAQTKGSLSFEVLGISGEGICQLVPAPAPITVDNVFQTMQALALIKAQLYDARTRVTPQLVAMDVVGTVETDPGKPREPGLFVPAREQPQTWKLPSQ